jgi:ubiquinone/menaquinone biosynthesis C-methylase UbiE
MNDMSTPSKPEQPSTYFVQDRSNQEQHRIEILDHLLTTGMGGVLPEQPDPSRFQSVLDVGCGTGGWLIEVAKAIPTCTRLVGVDAGRKFVDYANAQAKAAGVDDRVEFRTIDALHRLEFSDHSFDLVNQRFALSWLRTWDWPNLLGEYRRVCSRGGVMRITEPESVPTTSSPAQLRLKEIFLQAFYQAGHLFTPTNDGLVSELARLLREKGLQEVQTRGCTLEYHADTPEGQRFSENVKLVCLNTLPFVRRWTRVPEDYEQMYQQMLIEMQQPDFSATWHLLTAWGTV